MTAIPPHSCCRILFCKFQARQLSWLSYPSLAALFISYVFTKCFSEFNFSWFFFDMRDNFWTNLAIFISATARLGHAVGFLLSESSIKFLWLICSGITQKAERFGFCVFGLLSYYITTVLMNHLCWFLCQFLKPPSFSCLVLTFCYLL